MLLITKKTTLDEFRLGVEYFIKDPKTKCIYKMKRATVGAAYYMHSDGINMGVGKYLCWKGNVAVASLEQLLELIQSNKFRTI